ncbi:MAG: hypothetical protein V3S52_09985, partial [Gemmatimonadota bacterium]
VRAALSAAITNDGDEADRLDVLEGCYRVLGDAMDSMWTAWERFDQGVCEKGPRVGQALGSQAWKARCAARVASDPLC